MSYVLGGNTECRIVDVIHSFKYACILSVHSLILHSFIILILSNFLVCISLSVRQQHINITLSFIHSSIHPYSFIHSFIQPIIQPFIFSNNWTGQPLKSSHIKPTQPPPNESGPITKKFAQAHACKPATPISTFS